MRSRRRTLALALLLVLPAAAPAQRESSPSHVPVPRPEGVDAASLFTERIQQSRMRTDFDQLLQQLPPHLRNQPPEQLLQTLRQMLAQNPDLEKYLREHRDNPQFQEVLRNHLQNLPAGRGRDIDPARMRELYDQVLQPRPSARRGLPIEEALKRGVPIEEVLGRRAEPPPPREEPPPGRPPEPPRQRPKQSIPPTKPREPTARSSWSKAISRWAERAKGEEWARNLRNSPEFAKLLDQLSRADLSGGANLPDGWQGGLDAQLGRWEEWAGKVGDWLPKEWPEALTIDPNDLPEMPSLNLPDLHLGAPSLPSAPSLEMPAAGAADALQGVIIVAGVLAAALVIWKLLSRASAQAAGASAVRGPWPVDPAHVADREELIRAFEYLSLLRLGEPARHWHHRAIAAQLGGTAVERRRAATELAAAYEVARYAPAAEPLPPSLLETARRHLSFLAGATPA